MREQREGRRDGRPVKHARFILLGCALAAALSVVPASVVAQDTSPPGEATEGEGAPGVGDVVRVTSVEGWIREAPSSSSALVGTVPRGTDLRVLELEGNWLLVAVENPARRGWLPRWEVRELTGRQAPTAAAAQPPDRTPPEPRISPEPVHPPRPPARSGVHLGRWGVEALAGIVPAADRLHGVGGVSVRYRPGPWELGARTVAGAGGAYESLLVAGTVGRDLSPVDRFSVTPYLGLGYYREMNEYLERDGFGVLAGAHVRAGLRGWSVSVGLSDLTGSAPLVGTDRRSWFNAPLLFMGIGLVR